MKRYHYLAGLACLLATSTASAQSFHGSAPTTAPRTAPRWTGASSTMSPQVDRPVYQLPSVAAQSPYGVPASTPYTPAYQPGMNLAQRDPLAPPAVAPQVPQYVPGQPLRSGGLLPQTTPAMPAPGMPTPAPGMPGQPYTLPTPAPQGQPWYSQPGTPTPAEVQPWPQQGVPTPAAPQQGPAPTPWSGSYNGAPTWNQPQSQSFPQGPVYDQSGSQFQQAMGCEQGYCGPSCGDCGCCPPAHGSRFFGSVSGLMMTRNLPASQVFTLSNNDPTSNMLDGRQTVGDWRGGIEGRLGVAFGCHWALESVFWWVDPLNLTATATSAGDLTSTIPFDGLTAGGTLMATLYNNTRVQQIERRDEIYNFETNVLYQGNTGCGSRVSVMGLGGFRYLRFDETLLYSTATPGNNIGANAATGNYYTQVVNDLFGGQVGARVQLAATRRLRFYAMPKVGILENNIRKNVIVSRGDGPVGLNLSSWKTDVSMLGQLDFGAAFQFTPRLSAHFSYRGVGVTNVALADNQYDMLSMQDTAGVARVNSNGSLILHGMVSGLQFEF